MNPLLLPSLRAPASTTAATALLVLKSLLRGMSSSVVSSVMSSSVLSISLALITWVSSGAASSQVAGQELASVRTSSTEPHSEEANVTALTLQPGDRVVFAGNTFAERLALYGYFECALHAQHPDHQLVVRNLGWSADEVDLMPRPANFGSFEQHLGWQEADVVFLCYGMNESFAGSDALASWRTRLDAFVSKLDGQTFGSAPVRLVLVSPIAHEDLGAPLPTGEAVKVRNQRLKAYVAIMKEVAAAHQLPFVDLHTPTLAHMTSHRRHLTINGIHLNEWGDFVVSQMMFASLGWSEGAPTVDETVTGVAASRLRRVVFEKNQYFFYTYRPLNPYYVWGARAYCWVKDNPMRELERILLLVDEKDRQLWSLAQALDGSVWDSPPGAREVGEDPLDHVMSAEVRSAAVDEKPEIRRNGVIK